MFFFFSRLTVIVYHQNCLVSVSFLFEQIVLLMFSVWLAKPYEQQLPPPPPFNSFNMRLYKIRKFYPKGLPITDWNKYQLKKLSDDDTQPSMRVYF